MPNRVKAVTAYTTLKVQHMSPGGFTSLMQQLARACDDNIATFWNSRFEECWLSREAHGLPAANPRATDRFATDEEHVRSNIIQHSPVEWARKAALRYPDIDVWVWFGCSLLKQGDFTGKRIKEHHVRDFMHRVCHWEPNSIPLPGITPTIQPVDVHGNNWRFCGSTLVLPTKWLVQIERAYQYECRKFIREHKCVPLDLAIWPAVEQNSGLPIQWYPAEYDYTQLTNFPG